MATVFLSGSRKISRLNDLIRGRIKDMTEQGFRIVVGDANGADRALQGYLADTHYRDVVVFCAGSACRNNLGSWTVKNVAVPGKGARREFYTEKDKAMANEADFGFVLWDGKSVGSVNNIFELLKRCKPVVVYFGPEKQFYNLKYPSDVQALLGRCAEDDYDNISKKVQLERRLEDLGAPVQGSLAF
jgi:hypothetical protein